MCATMQPAKNQNSFGNLLFLKKTVQKTEKLRQISTKMDKFEKNSQSLWHITDKNHIYF